MVVIKNQKEGKQLAPVVLIVIFAVIMLLLGFVYLADTQSKEINITEDLIKTIQGIIK